MCTVILTLIHNDWGRGGGSVLIGLQFVSAIGRMATIEVPYNRDSALFLFYIIDAKGPSALGCIVILSHCASPRDIEIIAGAKAPRIKPQIIFIDIKQPEGLSSTSATLKIRSTKRPLRNETYKLRGLRERFSHWGIAPRREK